MYIDISTPFLLICEFEKIQIYNLILISSVFYNIVKKDNVILTIC